MQNVASVGDLFLTAGLAFFLFATLVRTPAETQAAVEEAKTGRYLGLSGTARLPRRGEAAGDAAGLGIRPGTGLTPGLEEAAALERPLMMGAGSMGMASPAQASLAPEGSRRGDRRCRTPPRPPPEPPPPSPAASRSRDRDRVGARSVRASAATRTCAWGSTARSRRCGWAR